MLKTERTFLRPPTDDDLDAMNSLYKDPDVSKRQLLCAIQSHENNGYGLLLICQKKTDLVIGYCNIKSSPLDAPHHIEMIYGLLQEWRGMGYAAEAAKEVLCWAFEKVDTDQIIGRVKPDNTASIRLLNKLGFKRIEDYAVPLSNEVENVFSIQKSKVSAKS